MSLHPKLPLKPQEFLQLGGNWVLLNKSWAGTGASLVWVRLEGEGGVQAGWDSSLPQESKALPRGWAHNIDRHPCFVCEQVFHPCFECEQGFDLCFDCEQVFDLWFDCEQGFVVSRPRLSSVIPGFRSGKD